jgi:hypothetical protein
MEHWRGHVIVTSGEISFRRSVAVKARPITAHCFAQYKRQSFTRAWSRVFANQSSDTINETRRRFDSHRRAFHRNFGAGVFLVIGNALEVVGLRQKNPQIVLEARIILGQAKKFNLHAFMGLEHLADALKDESLRG